MGTLSTDGLDPAKTLVGIFNLSHDLAHSDIPHESPTEIVPAFIGSLQYTFRFLTGSTLAP